MSESDFLSAAASVMGIRDASPDTRFRDVPGWCSMLGFGLMVAMENGFGAAPDIGEFMEAETLGDLYECAKRTNS